MKKRGALRLDRGLVVYSLIFFLVLFLCLTFIGRSLKIYRLRHDLADLQISLEQEERRRDDLRAHLALKDDPKTIEEVARERLGLVMPGEEKIIFVGE